MWKFSVAPCRVKKPCLQTSHELLLLWLLYYICSDYHPINRSSCGGHLHCSMQTFADGQNEQRQVSRTTDGKGETWSPSEMRSEEQARVSGGRLFHASYAATRKARSPRVAQWVDSTCSVVVLAERRQRWATISDVGLRLSDRYASAVLCTQSYARTHNRNWIRSGTCNHASRVAAFSMDCSQSCR